MEKYETIIKKTILGSLFIFLPVCLIYLLKLEVDSMYFYYTVTFYSLVVSPFWMKYMFTVPEDKVKMDSKEFGKFNFLFTGLIKYILIPPIAMMVGFLVYLGAYYLQEGNGFDAWIVVVFFLNFLLIRAVKEFTVYKSGRHIKK